MFWLLCALESGVETECICLLCTEIRTQAGSSSFTFLIPLATTAYGFTDILASSSTRIRVLQQETKTDCFLYLETRTEQ